MLRLTRQPTIRLEHPIDPIQRTRRLGITDCCSYLLATTRTLQTQLSHQPLDGATRHRNTFTIHLPPDLIGTIHLPVGMPDALNMRHQPTITLGTFTAEFGMPLPCCMTSVARRGNLQNLADRLDPVLAPVRIDKAFQFFKRRSSSAWAKNALAVFRISLARRSSLFSRSSCLSRSRSDVVRPSR